MNRARNRFTLRLALLMLVNLLAAPLAAATTVEITTSEQSGESAVTIVARQTPIAEVYEMLSRKERVNILLGKGVEGEVSVNLFDVSLDHAIRAVADAAGYAAERRQGTYVIINRDDAGQSSVDANTVVKTWAIHYADVEKVLEVVEPRLSRYGEATALTDRGIIVVEDLPGFVDRIDELITVVDGEPSQILIEAKILEIRLDETEAFGIDWNKMLAYGENGSGTFGVDASVSTVRPGLFFDFVTPTLAAYIEALQTRGRVRTLATPTLMAIEDEESEVVIGDRIGFRVTTTINQVTTESVEFLESGVILKFTASVHPDGQILLAVHPEVSTGTLDNGLPSQQTTEVTTRLLTADGQKVFIGGLIRDTETRNRRGVPLISDIPFLGRFFSRTERINVSTETVVLLTAHLISGERRGTMAERMRPLPPVQRSLEKRRTEIDRGLHLPWEIRRGDPPAPPSAVNSGPAEAQVVPQAAPENEVRCSLNEGPCRMRKLLGTEP